MSCNFEHDDPTVDAEEERYSAMDGANNDEDPDDIINLVARANSSKTDTNNILPRIRASPCQMHSKNSRRQQDLLYSSSHHGGKVPGHIDQTLRSHRQNDRQNVRISQTGAKPLEPRHAPPPTPVNHRRTSLPGDYQSQDFVMSWLIHGSAPTGENHFPEIVKDGQRSKTSQKHQRLRSSLLSE